MASDYRYRPHPQTKEGYTLMSLGVNYVGPRGPTDAKIVIVGEAPGADEERSGTPFMGKAGQLLTELLAEAGINRHYVYLTNVLKYRPANNNIDSIIQYKRGSLVTGQVWDMAVEELRLELEAIRPNVIVVTGNVPLYALQKLWGITNWRGSILESGLVKGCKVIPVFHPASALPNRQFLNRYLIATDLRRVKEESAFPELVIKKREYHLEPTFDECIQYLDGCMKADIIGFDIEVINEEVSCISFSYDESHAISIPFVANARDYFAPEDELIIWRRIAGILGSPTIKCIAHNASFDTTFLFRKYGIITSNIEDTMIAAGILYPEYQKSLAFITSICTDLSYYKDTGKERHKGGGASDMDYWLYNAKDSIVLLEAYPKLMQELETQGNVETYNRQANLILPFLYMTEHGLRANAPGMIDKAEAASIEIARLQMELNDIAGQELNPNSPAQCVEYFYDKLGHKPYTNRGALSPTTDEKAMVQLARKGVREAQYVLDIRKLVKLAGTYYKMGLDEDKRIRSSINIVGTKSGRVSSSKTIFKTGGNLQNMPDEMLELVLIDEGYIGYEIDLTQAENMIVAYIGNDSRMIDAFENGRDVHSLTASLIFGGPPEKKYQGTIDAPIGRDGATQRDWGKRANHGLNYDLGPGTFSLTWEIKLADAKRIIDAYHQAYPGVRRYQSIIRSMLNDRTLTNLLNRSRIFLSMWGDSLFKEAYSFIPQSTVADIINPNGFSYIYDRIDLFPEVILLNQIHDSIWLEIPSAVGLGRHAEILNNIMQNLQVPLTWRDHTFTIPTSLKVFPKNMAQSIMECTNFVTEEDLGTALLSCPSP